MSKYDIAITVFLTIAFFLGIILHYKKNKVDNHKKRKKGKTKVNVKANVQQPSKISIFIEKYEWLIFSVLMLIAFLARFWLFPNVPGGLNQDEASIGYDSYSIANFGIDRNGFPFPVYPIAWGAGHGPFYTYFCMPFIKLFGLSVFTYRLPQALLALTSVAVFYLILKRIHGVKTGLLGLFILAICPWHIMLSRWALDSNPLPAVFLIATYFLVLGTDSGKALHFYISAGIFGLCLYVYGSIFVVIPVFILITLVYLLCHKKINVKTLLFSGLVFLLVSMPMIIFMAINIFKLPEIITPFFSFSHFTVIRSSAIFLKMHSVSDFINSVKNYINYVFLQKYDDHPYNIIPQFGNFYLYSLPLVLGGIVIAFKRFKFKECSKEIVFLAWFIAASIMVLMIDPNINRISIIFIPILYFLTLGLDFIMRNTKYVFTIIILIFMISFGFFAHNYFTINSNIVSHKFYESFGDAVKFASDKTNGEVYITSDDVNGNYILTLFYMKTNPHEFSSTVRYYDPHAEFRMAERFGRYRFYIPEIPEQDKVYVISLSQINKFDTSLFNIKQFKYYAVAYPKG